MGNTIVLFYFLLTALISPTSTSSNPIKSTARSTTLSAENQWGSSGYTWAADFNGDGKADIASASGGNVYLYISTGVDFELTNSSVANTWGSSGYTWVADFNDDGMADIASASGRNVYMNFSTGTGFTSTTWTVPGNWGSSGYTWAADFNGDGMTDIASAFGGNVYMNLSTGISFNSTTWTVPGTWGSSGYTWAADFNGDGKADVASASAGNVYVNLSTGTSFTSTIWTVPNNWQSSGYTWVADFNGDGKADIASAKGGNIYMNLSTGTSFTSTTWTVPANWGSSDYTWVADFNFDGASGIASARGGNVYMNLSTGTGFTSTTWTVSGNWGSSGYTWVADFNGDSYPDIASLSGNTIYMSLSRGARFASETWYSYSDTAASAKNSRSNINSSVNQVVVLNAGTTFSKSTTLKQCRNKFGVGTWAIDFDTRRSLSYTMSLTDLGYVKTLLGPSDITAADDGLYIFVMHSVRQPGGGFIDSLRIRRSDRPDDVGFAVQGLKQYSYQGNIPCPNVNPQCVLATGENPETPHQFVRHTQLNQGTSPVASAGQLQIRNGRIIWISNASGHFAPSKDSLDCVEEYLDVLKIPRAKYDFKRDHYWTHWIEPKDEL